MKSLVERVLYHGGIAGLSRRRLRGAVLVLGYHNVVPEGEAVVGERSLHISQRRFGEHLDVISDSHEIVALRHVLEAPNDPQLPRVAITFDDAYRGALIAGVQELASRDLPATIFVAPRFAEEGSGFWWDKLAPGENGGVPRERWERFRRDAMERHSGRNDEIVGFAESRGAVPRTLPEHATPGSIDDLRSAAGAASLRFGSHTWSHPDLTALRPDEVRNECTRASEWIRSEGLPRDEWIAYPYNRVSATVVSSVRKAGFHGGLTLDGRWSVRDRVDPFLLPRLSVPAAMTPEGLGLRLAGLFCR